MAQTIQTSDHSTQAQPHKRKTKRQRMVRRITLFLLLFVPFCLCTSPIGFAFMITRDIRASVGDPPAGFVAHTLIACNGDQLAAWYHPPSNGAVIILLHGSGGSREAMRQPAIFLVENGYGALLLDLRGHGESGGQPNMAGWQGTDDVGAAVDFLLAQPDVTAIGGWGFSLGGEVLLGAAGAYPQITAIVSDGATFRTYEDALTVPKYHIVPFRWMLALMYRSLEYFSGDQPPIPIIEALANAPTTHFLLVAGGKVGQEKDYNRHFQSIVGDRAELWIAPNVGHVEAFGRLREDYTTRVLDFFGTTLLPASLSNP